MEGKFRESSKENFGAFRVIFMMLLMIDFELIKEDPERSEFLHSSEFLKQNFKRVP